MDKSKIVIVDMNDTIIDYKDRAKLEKGDIYRVSALWVKNSQGEILLAQRGFNKKHDPGKWGPAVAGTVEENETYESNIIKEIEEEIGIKNYDLRKSFCKFYDGEYRFFTQWFITVLDKKIYEFNIQKDEVEQIRWFTQEEIKNNIILSPESFLPSVIECVDFFYKR